MKNLRLTIRGAGKIRLAFFMLFLWSCQKESNDDVIVVQANGDITASVNQFRQLLGATLNTTPGAVGGRREINWDGIPADLLGKPLPPDFFNTVGDNVPASRQRGLTYASASGSFIVSNDGFEEVNSAAAKEFSAFSGDKVFANVSNSLWEIKPSVAGKAEAATVRGFGIVFSDVDVPNSAFMEFFEDGKSLGKFFVPVHNGNSGFSFLGVYFKTHRVTSIKVGHDGSLSEGGKDISEGGTRDFVVMDDFLYDEPVKK